MTIEVEKNVPMPKPAHGGGKLKYPWDSMKIHDSFLVPYNGRSREVVASTVSGAGRSYSKRRNYEVEFTTRRTREGVRVWRVA